MTEAARTLKTDPIIPVGTRVRFTERPAWDGGPLVTRGADDGEYTVSTFAPMLVTRTEFIAPYQLDGMPGVDYNELEILP